MDEETFDRRLQELIQEIANLPADKQKQLAPLVKETKERHKTTKANIDKINKSLIDLRICLKYLLFDLEATRRERDQLKTMFENPPDNDEPNKANGEI